MRKLRAKDRSARQRPGERGFTLIEVAIVVLIVGILATIAYPSYQEQVRKARRSDAKNALMDTANRQEQYMLDHLSYTTDVRNLGFAANPGISADGYYSISATAGTCGAIARCYALTATPVAGKSQALDAKCTSFKVESTGRRTAQGSIGDECWQ